MLSQFSDVTVLALMVAAGLAAVLGYHETESGWLQRYGDTGAILLIVALNAVMGFVQEGRAHRALTALKGLLSPNAEVVRDGQRVQLPARQLVPGDIVLLQEGARVPADARLVEATDLLVDEATLTGESVPVDKHATEVLEASCPLAERLNMVFMGTYVQRGAGRAVITATGKHTEMGSVAEMLDDVSAETTPLERQMRSFGLRVVVGCAVLAVALFALGALTLHAELGVLVLTVVSLAVAAIPEGLPAITTVVLALGVRRMAEKNAVVRRLAAVEALGSAHVICTDKTGTLTQNRMTVRRVSTAQHDLETAAALARSAADNALQELLQAAQFSPAAHRAAEPNAFTGDPTDAALLELHTRAKLPELHADVIRIHPFSSDRKLASVLVKHDDGAHTSYVHGAPERVLEHCSEMPPRLQDTLTAWAATGLRVLALAKREFDSDPNDAEREESQLTFLGLVGLSDPPRPEVQKAIQTARAAGIDTIMITGDHPTTARAIAAELGLAPPGAQVLSSGQLSAMDEADLDAAVAKLSVVARATAADKLRIIQSLTRSGKVVAMTGDGVNDAPAIRAAAIGIAMGKTGTDVSREVADLVLADDNYATIVEAVREGRIIYANIQRFIAFLFAANAGLVLLVTAAMLMNWPPVLTPTQILWINLITNGLPALALGMEPKAGDPMKRPPRPASEGLLRPAHWLEIAAVGSALAGLGAWAFMTDLEAGGLAHARSVAFSVLALAPVLYAFSARTEHWLHRGVLDNRTLLVAVAASVGLQALALYAPGMNAVFGTVPLDAAGLGIAASCALGLVGFAEVLKLTRRLSQKPSTRP